MIRPDWKQPLWDERVKLMAALVPRGSRVLDVGAGAQTLRRYLKDCTYSAADLDSDPALDFESGLYPEGWWDVAVLSGALEYASRPGVVLKELARLTPRAFISFSHGGSLDYRRRQGWRCHLSRAAFEQLAERAGWKHKIVGHWRGHSIYEVTR